MAYQINKTDGTVVATVADGQIDSLSTDLTLIGKNYSGFGEYLNENLIKLLENFASTTRPTHPIRGQIWFDVSELKLKVYSGTQFLPVSSATIANTQPTTLGVGDLWFNDVDEQLYFFDGNTAILLGPSYSASQGLSGLKVESILDTLNQTRVVTYLYNNGILLGIFSKDTFTPKNAISGFSGSIIPGFNAGSLAGLKFNVTCTNAEQLGGAVATTYVRKDTANSIDGQLRITSDLGVVIGSGNQLNLTVNNGNVFMSNAASDKNLTLNVRKGITQEDAVIISASTRTVDIYPGFTGSQVNIGGSLTITGNFTVEGTTTTVNTATLTIEDKNIELAKSTSPSDTNADGGGITLKGDTDHTFNWSNSGDSWNSSEHINLVAGREFKINGVTVLSGTSLGSGITSIPGVTSFGTQNVVNVGPGTPPVTQMRLENHRISTISNNYDIELYPDGTGDVVLNGTAQIKSLADPTLAQDAATKEYVDDVVETRDILLSLDLSDGRPNSYIITNVLNVMAPPGTGAGYWRDGTRAKILCTVLGNSTTSLDLNPLISESTAEFNTPTGTAYAVTNVTGGTATVPASAISVIRYIKTFQIFGGTWTWISDGSTF
jgi:hypothetical protein